VTRPCTHKSRLVSSGWSNVRFAPKTVSDRYSDEVIRSAHRELLATYVCFGSLAGWQVRDVRFDCQRDKNHAPRALSLRANQILIAFGRHGITLHSLRCSSFLVCVGKEPVERSLFDALCRRRLILLFITHVLSRGFFGRDLLFLFRGRCRLFRGLRHRRLRL
jgi:hypothetical protein